MRSEEADAYRVRITDVGGADDVGGDPQQVTAGKHHGRRPINPFFGAAWSLTTGMLLLGVVWLVFFTRGVDPETVRYADYGSASTDPVGTSSYPTIMNTMQNYVDAGPLLLVGGCILAGLLLAVHGLTWHRKG